MQNFPHPEQRVDGMDEMDPATGEGVAGECSMTNGCAPEGSPLALVGVVMGGKS